MQIEEVFATEWENENDRILDEMYKEINETEIDESYEFEFYTQIEA